MDVVEARAVLGVGPSASDEELRSAYRARLRATHPDLRGGGDGGTARVVAAYRALRDAPAPAPDRTAGRSPAPAPVVVDGHTVSADLPAGDLVALLAEAAESIGEVAYLDRRAGVLEVVVDVAGHGACSVVLAVQGRAAGHTEAWCTAEPLGGGPPPSPVEIAQLLATGLATVAATASRQNR